MFWFTKRRAYSLMCMIWAKPFCFLIDTYCFRQSNSTTSILQQELELVERSKATFRGFFPTVQLQLLMKKR